MRVVNRHVIRHVYKDSKKYVEYQIPPIDGNFTSLSYKSNMSNLLNEPIYTEQYYVGLNTLF